jgi:hypothetical protein
LNAILNLNVETVIIVCGNAYQTCLRSRQRPGRGKARPVRRVRGDEIRRIFEAYAAGKRMLWLAESGNRINQVSIRKPKSQLNRIDPRRGVCSRESH